MATINKLINFEPKIPQFINYFRVIIDSKRDELIRKVEHKYQGKTDEKDIFREINEKTHVSKIMKEIYDRLDQIVEHCKAICDLIRSTNV